MTTTDPKATSTSATSPTGQASPAESQNETDWDLSNLTNATPAYLVPKMDHEAVSTPVFYRQLIMHDPAAFGTSGREITKAIDPFRPLEELALPGMPIEGALITYEQGWYEKGLALGRLLHSTCLAPGEVTKLAITSFRRSSTGQSNEAATQSDQITSETDQTAAVHETQRAVAHETQSGSSFHTGLSTQSQAALSGGGLFVSGSAATALSTAMGVSTSTSSGAREAAANGARNLSQHTVAASHSVRGRRATQVREATEAEGQSANTRVLANYNHMHALTMMFFEVLQVYELTTKPVHAERVVFLPMKGMVFNEANILANSGQLLDIFSALDLAEEVKALEEYLTANLYELRKQESVYRNRLENTIRSIGYDPNDDYYSYPHYRGIVHDVIPSILSVINGYLERGDALPESEKGILKSQQDLYDDFKGNYDRFLEHHVKLKRVTRVEVYLQSQSLRFSQYLWLMLDPARVQRLIVDLSFKGTALDHLMDPRPLGVHGNYLAFRLPHATAGGDADFVKQYVADDAEGPPIAKLVLPSSGVFGEAVLGQAVSAEKIDLTRFWNWKDSPIPILPPDMSPLNLASRARGQEFSRVEMETSITELLKPIVPAGPQLNEIVGKIMGNFHDMSGQAQLGSLLAAQVAASQSGAAKAGTLSVETLKANQAFGEKLLNSDIVKAGFAAAFPEGEAATMLGGLIGATKGTPKSGPKAVTKAGPSQMGPTVTPPKSVKAKTPPSSGLGPVASTKPNKSKGTKNNP